MISWSVFTSVCISCLSYKSTQVSTKLFFILEPALCRGIVIFKLRTTSNICHNQSSSEPIPCFWYTVVSVSWQLSLIKGLQIIFTTNIKAIYKSLLLHITCAFAVSCCLQLLSGSLSNPQERTRFLRRLKDNGRRFICSEYTVCVLLQ